MKSAARNLLLELIPLAKNHLKFDVGSDENNWDYYSTPHGTISEKMVFVPIANYFIISVITFPMLPLGICMRSIAATVGAISVI